jgi:triacylglycerol esterase/lipase EstA (alpha/beta hydrolase family)
MNPLTRQARRLRRRLDDLRSLFDLKARNQIVRRTDFTRCPRPVLLLHGFFGTRRTFRILETRLRHDGFCVFSVNLGGLLDVFNTGGIDESAERVRDKIERLYARYPNLGPLSVIGHSKGGLIGRYYVKRLGGDRRVCTLITLGTPHHGTPTAYAGVLAVGMVAKSVWQMTPMSPFIRRLKLGAFPASVRFVSVYSKADKASPFPTCILEANQANLYNVEVPGIGHRDFLVRRSVYEVVRRELSLGLGEEQPQQPRPQVAPTRPHLVSSE